MRFLDHKSHACLTLSEVASFPHWLYHFAISLPPVIFQQWYFIAGMKVPAVLYPTQELDISSLFNRGCVVVTHYGFNLHHPLSDVEHLCESSVPLLSRVWVFATPWTAARQASLSITNSWSLLRLTSIESVMPSNHLILCHPLLLLPSFFPSIRVFSSESVLHIRWPEDWSFSFCISPSSEYLGLISFRIVWFDCVYWSLMSFMTSIHIFHSFSISLSSCYS